MVSETPSYAGESDRPPSRGGAYGADTPDGGGYSIPGFPIQDSDARSIRTNVSLRRSASVSKVIRRIRGEGVDDPSLVTVQRLSYYRIIPGLLDGRRALQRVL